MKASVGLIAVGTLCLLTTLAVVRVPVERDDSRIHVHRIRRSARTDKAIKLRVPLAATQPEVTAEERKTEVSVEPSTD